MTEETLNGVPTDEVPNCFFCGVTPQEATYIAYKDNIGCCDRCAASIVAQSIQAHKVLGDAFNRLHEAHHSVLNKLKEKEAPKIQVAR